MSVLLLDQIIHPHKCLGNKNPIYINFYSNGDFSFSTKYNEEWMMGITKCPKCNNDIGSNFIRK